MWPGSGGRGGRGGGLIPRTLLTPAKLNRNLAGQIGRKRVDFVELEYPDETAPDDITDALQEDDFEEVLPAARTDQEIEDFYLRGTFRVIHQTNNFFLPQIKDLIVGRSILNIRPEYQRRLSWTIAQKSRLIESLLLNIPVPPVFLFEGDLAQYEVMDGQQRLNAIKEFLSGEFRLSSLSTLTPLAGKTYAQLPPRVRRGLDRATVQAIVLLLESDSAIAQHGSPSKVDIRHYIFERLNTGGKRLNAQEIRNAVFAGRLNEAVIKLSRNRTFTDIWGIPPYTESDPNDYYENPKRQANSLYRTMLDCQIVLRFFAFCESKRIRGSVRSILDSYMRDNRRLSEDQVEQLSDRFKTCIETAHTLFEGNAFRLTPERSPRNRPSVALYDAVMVAIFRLWDQRHNILANAEEVREKIYELVAAQAETGMFTGQANTSKSISERISLVEDAIKSRIFTHG